MSTNVVNHSRSISFHPDAMKMTDLKGKYSSSISFRVNSSTIDGEHDLYTPRKGTTTTTTMTTKQSEFHRRRSSVSTVATVSTTGFSSSRYNDEDDEDDYDNAVKEVMMYSASLPERLASDEFSATEEEDEEEEEEEEEESGFTVHHPVMDFDEGMSDSFTASDWSSDDDEDDDEDDSEFDEEYEQLMNEIESEMKGNLQRPAPAVQQAKTETSSVKKSLSNTSLVNLAERLKEDRDQSALSATQLHEQSSSSITNAKALLDSICSDLQHVGRQILVESGDVIRQRAKVLASINFLSSHLPNCVLHQLGKEVRKTDSNQEMPYTQNYKCALLFVDISGFTKLATLMDPENLSKIINKYFQLLVDKVEEYGGDIQKYAGDAIFVEWRASSHNDGPTLDDCVGAAAACAASMVQDYSDYHVLAQKSNYCVNLFEADHHTLNIHCGLGVGNMTSIHVGNDTQRREYLYFGEPITQATEACDKAKPGQAIASPKFLMLLEDVLDDGCNDSCDYFSHSSEVIATKSTSIVTSLMPIYSKQKRPVNKSRGVTNQVDGLELEALKEYRRLISLYVHPVVVMNDIAARENFSSHDDALLRSGTLQEQRREDAELRHVYVIFIKPILPRKILMAGTIENSSVCTSDVPLLNDIMNVTSRELDTHKGHLRQFIVDDKGLVLIATFGLRGSTFPNMVTERALPATLALHKSFTTELGIDCRIGATFGDVYCGNVGGEQRQEFTVMGPSVNLAARLMCCPRNSGILVDHAIRSVASRFYNFNDLEPVIAKGYSEPVCIYEPTTPITKRENRSMYTSTEEIILCCIDELDLAERAALNVGAVLGDTFTLDEVDYVMQENHENKLESRKETLESLEHAVRGGILRTVQEEARNSKERNPVFAFESPIWRSTLLNLMLASRKRDVHKKIALNLEANQNEADLSIELGEKIVSHWMYAGNANKTTAAVLTLGSKIEQSDASKTHESIQLYEDALKLWGWKEACNTCTGGLSPNVLKVLREDQLKDIIALMVARGRRYRHTGATRKSIDAFKDVLQIKKSNLVSTAMPDMSITFPAYDGVIDGISQVRTASEAKFEENLINDFLEATFFHGKMVHHLHALYLKINYFHRTAQFEKAVSVHLRIHELYQPEIHSKGLRKFYEKDGAALSYAICSQSELALHKARGALTDYRSIIHDILPKIDSDFSQSFEMAYRMIWVLKRSGYVKEARTIFDKMVGNSFVGSDHDNNGFLSQFLKTIDLLLSLSGEENASEDSFNKMFSLVSECCGEMGVFTEEFKIRLGQLGRCADSISAEIQLLLAKQTRDEVTRSNLKSQAFELLNNSLEFLNAAGLYAASLEVHYIIHKWKDFQ